MSADLLEELAQYGVDHRSRQAPVERPEILARVRELDVDGESPHFDEPKQPRRMRHRFPIAAAAAMLLVVTAGLMLTARSDESEPSDVPGTDHIRTIDSTTPSTPMTTPSVVTTTTAVPEATIPAEVGPSIPSISARTFAGRPTSVAGTSYDDSRTLGPWGDGFLVIAVTGGFQMNAELSDEMFARLPAVVREAYPDQLQGPLGEVIARLQEDGLLDEVQAALEADPELEEAILSGETTPIELTAEYSVDGDVWTEVVVAAPDGMNVDEVLIADGRVVAVGMPPPSLAESADVPYRTMVIASTVDLKNWSIQTVPDVVETINEVSIVVNERGWVAHIEPDFCEVDQNDVVGCSSPTIPSYGYDVGEGPPLTWAASWSGVPAAVEGAAAAEGVTVMALHTGFLVAHEELLFSPDGLTWSPIDGAPSGVVLQGALPLDDGNTAVATFADTCEAEVYRVDRSGQTWELIELEIDDAPPNLLPNRQRRFSNDILASSLHTSASLFDDSGPIVSTMEFDKDGLRLTRRTCWASSRHSESYELVDVVSGTVLVSESTNGWIDDDSSSPGGNEVIFDHLTDNGDGVTVLDPDTGAELLVADQGAMRWIDFGVGGPSDVWLLATSTGAEWLVEDLVQVNADPPYANPQAAARNGDTILVATETAWLSYQVPGS